LQEILAAAGATAELLVDRVPVLAGASELTEKGVVSSLWVSNVDSYADTLRGLDLRKPSHRLLFDPQTAGGLLIVARGSAADYLEKHEKTTRIGAIKSLSISTDSTAGQRPCVINLV